MTLQEWCKETGEKADRHTNGGYTVVMQGLTMYQKQLLWYLQDYAVSSVNGPVAWLSSRMLGNVNNIPCFPTILKV